MISNFGWSAIALLFGHFALGISIRSIVACILLGCLFFVGLLVTYQENIMYVPIVSGYSTVATNPPGYQSPEEYGLKFEDVFVKTIDGEDIHVWYVPGESSIVFLECHGNAGNLGLRLPSLVAARKKLKVGVAIFDYRGYGSSSGKPSEEGFLKDLNAVHDWLLTKIRGDQIVLHGRSVGGSLVIQHAAKRPHADFAGVLAENTFLSISKVVDTQFPYLAIPYLKDWILRIKWETLVWLRKFPKGKPLLLISGVQDEIVPHVHRLELFKTAKDHDLLVELEVFASSGHNDVWTAGPQYWSSQDKWLRSFRT